MTDLQTRILSVLKKHGAMTLAQLRQELKGITRADLNRALGFLEGREQVVASESSAGPKWTAA